MLDLTEIEDERNKKTLKKFEVKKLPIVQASGTGQEKRPVS